MQKIVVDGKQPLNVVKSQSFRKTFPERKFMDVVKGNMKQMWKTKGERKVIGEESLEWKGIDYTVKEEEMEWYVEEMLRWKGTSTR